MHVTEGSSNEVTSRRKLTILSLCHMLICPTTIYYVSTSVQYKMACYFCSLFCSYFFPHDVISPILSFVPHPFFPLLYDLTVSSLTFFPTCQLRLADLRGLYNHPSTSEEACSVVNAKVQFPSQSGYRFA